MTQEELFTLVRAMGLTVGKTPYGEYRISLPGVGKAKAEAIAYYTNDRADALLTARFMAERLTVRRTTAVIHPCLPAEVVMSAFCDGQVTAAEVIGMLLQRH